MMGESVRQIWVDFESVASNVISHTRNIPFSGLSMQQTMDVGHPDMDNRDVNDLNSHLRVRANFLFESVEVK